MGVIYIKFRTIFTAWGMVVLGSVLGGSGFNSFSPITIFKFQPDPGDGVPRLVADPGGGPSHGHGGRLCGRGKKKMKRVVTEDNNPVMVAEGVEASEV